MCAAPILARYFIAIVLVPLAFLLAALNVFALQELGLLSRNGPPWWFWLWPPIVLGLLLVGAVHSAVKWVRGRRA